jgi:hypothetical protein
VVCLGEVVRSRSKDTKHPTHVKRVVLTCGSVSVRHPAWPFNMELFTLRYGPPSWVRALEYNMLVTTWPEETFWPSTPNLHPTMYISANVPLMMMVVMTYET